VALRVHGGEARGRVLHAPRGIRPSSGQVVEAIFNMVGERVPGARVIDLFAGSGALGIEALSRGAAHATFVERSQGSASILRRNLDELNYSARAEVVPAEAVRWLAAHPAQVAAATLVLLDPPYADDSSRLALRELDRAAAPGTVVVAELGTRARLPDFGRLREMRARRYGDSELRIYEVPAT
jgi:16S rRNA (guanine966-N2)-methyltransferase